MNPYSARPRRAAPPANRQRLAAALCLLGGLGLAGSLWADITSAPAGKTAFVIPIQGEIDDIQRDSVNRRIAEARAAGAGTVIFEMHTPGGLVTSALDISSAIKKLADEGVRTVAWVNDEAYSAGALISVACQHILMTSTGSIGDCAPILLAPTGVEELGDTERAKVESPILQEFRDSAVRNGYDSVLSRAMVTVGAEVWWIENPRSGERRFVETRDKQELVDDAATDDAWQLVRTYSSAINAGKSVPLDQPVDGEAALLTLGADEAVAFGFARGIAPTLSDVQSQLALSAAPQTLDLSGWEVFAMWLNGPLVRGMLFVIFIIGAYMEFQHPGLIVPGATAAVALAIFLAAPYAAGLANVWTIAVLLIGVALLGIELFILPGFGIAGIAGIGLILVAAVATFVPEEPGRLPFSIPRLEGTWDALKTGVMVTSSSIFVGIAGIVLLAKYLPYTPLARGLTLENPMLATVPSAALHVRPAVGDVGVVTGTLRPGGQARFGQDVIDVTAVGEFVDAGRKVQVTRLEGMNIVVRPLDEA